jgi:uncharacterized protein (TIGR02284 family)
MGSESEEAMTMSNRQTLKALSSLYRIVEAGERGYAVAAANVDNRGLKLLFKSFAQQRANFKTEIFKMMQYLESHVRVPGSGLTSILAMIHRGRIDIFAALTIGDENVEKVVLKEVVLGEGVALRAYENTLKKDLPPDVRELVAHQFNEVRQVVEQVNLMRGRDGKRLLIRLYDTETDANHAVQRLQEAGFHQEDIERVAVDRSTVLYTGRGTTILETILSGAVGGAFWGAVIGVLAAIGVLQMPAGIPSVGPRLDQSSWAFIAFVLCIAGGTFVGTMIGTFIGWGIKSSDDYLYDQGLERGRILVRLLTDESRASKAWQTLAQVNVESRERVKEIPA